MSGYAKQTPDQAQRRTASQVPTAESRACFWHVCVPQHCLAPVQPCLVAAMHCRGEGQGNAW